ncbi:TetR/AcrR family transcriptional regulator [Seohaeicola saemankumensis]|nr:TetR/AcrR family transcriptional regulator [Seohaeicola saemankumensis]MCA0869548.1 TetR/AcrR family transcriptional regulator [Seohaeicola saemankumensis]
MEQVSTKGKILKSAYTLFRKEGFTRVSVDAIANRAGVTKRTVYYHFQSKDDIVADVLTDQHEYLLRQFQEWAGSAEQTPVQLVQNLFARLYQWAEGTPFLGSGFTRIATELADRPGHPARQAASSHKALVEQWLADRLAKAGHINPKSTARSIVTLIEGSMILALIHGETEYIETAGRAACELARLHEL